MHADSLDPRRLPQFAEGWGRYHRHALDALLPLRLAEGYQLRVEAIPDDANATLGSKGIHERRVALMDGSWVWAISGSSSHASGFKVQITDERTRGQFFSTPVQYQNCTGQGSSSGVTNPLFILPKPQLVLAPGQITVQLTNLAEANNAVQLLLWIAEPLTL